MIAATRPTTCPTCSKPVQQPWTGRPRSYCSLECRKAMDRGRIELSRLEAELDDAVTRAKRRDASSYWTGRAVQLRNEIAALRARVAPVLGKP